MKNLNLTKSGFLTLFLIGLIWLLPSCKPETDGPKFIPVPAGSYTSEVPNAWFTLLTTMAKTKPYNAQSSLRLFAYSGVALYESVAPGMIAHQSIYMHLTGNTLELPTNVDLYWPACANAAIASIASKIVQNYSSPNLDPINALESSLYQSFVPIVKPEQLKMSVEYGRFVADKIYEWSKTDGTLNPDGTLASCPPYVYPTAAAGNWLPTPPAFIPPQAYCHGELDPFLPKSMVTELLPPPPPSYSTDPASLIYKNAEAIYQVSLDRTPDDVKQINNWGDLSGTTHFTPAAHTLKLTTDIISQAKLNLEEASVLYAKQTMAASDAIIAAVHAKYHYFLQRPVSYIRNILTKSTWNPAFATPPLPSYSSFQSLQASSIEILESYFGKNFPVIDSAHQNLYGTFSYSKLGDLLKDIEKAAKTNGIYWSFSVDAGIEQGRKIGQRVNQLPFNK